MTSALSPSGEGGIPWFPMERPPKNWKDKWLWVNHSLAGSGRYRANSFADITPKLFPYNQGFADLLKNIQVSPEDYSEVLLAGVGMIPSWRRRGKMAVFFAVVDGKCFLLLFLFSPSLFLLISVRVFVLVDPYTLTICFPHVPSFCRC